MEMDICRCVLLLTSNKEKEKETPYSSIWHHSIISVWPTVLYLPCMYIISYEDAEPCLPTQIENDEARFDLL